MRYLHTEILVIGGGATGTGILRDLAMRGFHCILVEKRDLAYGTTGRYHGLLHSGARYVVKDPLAARDCIDENRILRKIMPQCIEDTGGFFVLTKYDDPSYISSFLEGCHSAGIPVDEITISQMLRSEPSLDPSIQRCFRVPDASADSFLAADLNAESARLHGAQVLTYHQVKTLSVENRNGKSVTGIICQDLVKDEDVQITADVTVNASGAWAGLISHMAGINLQMLPGKGTMIALNHRVVNTVINRCKLPSDGDILVPAHTVAVMGTTDIRVSDPDHYPIEPWEIRLMLDEGEKIIPKFKGFRILRTWAGVRPLIQEEAVTHDRNISRAFALIDHKTRDDVGGFITITSGKWTTYRRMAQATVDKVCEKLGSDRPCKTHLEMLPDNANNGVKLYVGYHLEKIEKEIQYGQLVCECELATREEVENSIINKEAKSIDDIRRDVRLGMGPCQAAFCAIRAAGLLHELRNPPIEDINVSLRNFLQERWKGELPILWGQQLRQQRLNELIYVDVLNATKLPGKFSSNISVENYQAQSEPSIEQSDALIPAQENPTIDAKLSYQSDIVVIGAGLAGLIAGIKASSLGKRVHLISKGWGAQYWGSGCIDIFGYQPLSYTDEIQSPIDFIEKFNQSNPEHPYSKAGRDNIIEAIAWFLKLCKDNGLPYTGSLEKNIWLPTALGTLRPTCLAPYSMHHGDINLNTPMLIVGFDQFLDFYPSMIAANLSAQNILANSILLDLKPLRKLRFISTSVLARLFDREEFRYEVINAIKPRIGHASRIGFPAVLGFNKSDEVVKDLETSLGVPIFEIPGLPPSIPGIRLHNVLVSAIERIHGSVHTGMMVNASITDENKIISIISEAAAMKISHNADTYLLATGGILGGGTLVNHAGYAQDTVFNFPIDIRESNNFLKSFLDNGGNPIYAKGLSTDSLFQPINYKNQVIYKNLFAVGSALGSCDPVRERSLEGIALVTGYTIGKRVAEREY